MAELGIRHDGPRERDGRLVLDFEDPEGQRLSLMEDADAGPAHPWAHSPVPTPHQINGLGPVTVSVPEPEALAAVLTRILGMRRGREYVGAPSMPTTVFEMGPGGAAAELHVTTELHLPPARLGAGGVHHVAFRIPDAAYEAWADRLVEFKVRSSGPVDRFYFRSLYFREPNGILFEIATDGPGFAADEPVEKLGQRLSLPPFLEDRRSEIEAKLKPL